MSFQEFFQVAMGARVEPYPYQERVACEAWPGLLEIPTGMGKTAAVILSWLYKRSLNDPETPRRLVYCLPMRVLVEQTEKNARSWFSRLFEAGILPSDSRPSVSRLMGGEVDTEWESNPEKSAIVVGTQDQLISRALNRGYAMSRFRWPVHFGLLNNDCFWVLDEIQLMGNALATTAQLQAFRKEFGTALPTGSMWMSATLRQEWLETVDFRDEAKQLRCTSLTSEDLARPEANERFHARKAVQKAPIKPDNMNALAKLILDAHAPGSRSLVVVNKVRRAMELYEALKRKRPAASLTLIHSRFRPPDRVRALEKLLEEPGDRGTICISTQVVEAGVDVSAKTLITDLAPWASLVQRFGRCNRDGKEAGAQVIWIDLDLKKKNAALPYSEEDLRQSAELLTQLTDAGPVNLPECAGKIEYRHVLRRKDVIDLFDTTPDLAGSDVDVSRFIREADDHDVQVFWRELPSGAPKEDERGPARDELCPVSINEIKALDELEKWRWDPLERKWLKPQTIVPGTVLMLRRSDGRYAPEMGWTGKKQDILEPVDIQSSREEAIDDDFSSSLYWQTLKEHTEQVVEETAKLLRKFDLPENLRASMHTAAVWHDAGKAHRVFQQAMVGDPPERDPAQIWGKTERRGVRYERRGFRHELASALAMLEHGLPDLAVYLAAAHHGKVRLSIRSLPYEARPPDPESRFARGIYDQDMLGETLLTESCRLPQTTLDLSYMELGEGPRGPSWLARMLALRDDKNLGMFRLGFLEALLRVADWRASSGPVAQDA